MIDFKRDFVIQIDLTNHAFVSSQKSSKNLIILTQTIHLFKILTLYSSWI